MSEIELEVRTYILYFTVTDGIYLQQPLVLTAPSTYSSQHPLLTIYCPLYLKHPLLTAPSTHSTLCSQHTLLTAHSTYSTLYLQHPLLTAPSTHSTLCSQHTLLTAPSTHSTLYLQHPLLTAPSLHSTLYVLQHPSSNFHRALFKVLSLLKVLTCMF